MAILLGGRDAKTMSAQERNRIIQYVFQDPAGGLDPRKTIRQILTITENAKSLGCAAEAGRLESLTR